MLAGLSGWFGNAAKSEQAKAAEAEAQSLVHQNTVALREVADNTAYVFNEFQKYVQKNHRNIDKGIDALTKVVVLVGTVHAVATHPWYTAAGCVAGGVVSSHLTDIARRVYQTRQHLSPSSQLFLDVAAGYVLSYIPAEIVTTLTGSVVSAHVVEQAKGKFQK